MIRRSRAPTILRLAAALLLPLVASSFACAPPPMPERKAFLYGISLYSGAVEGMYPNLTYADDDAEAMAALLGSEANGWTVALRTDYEATRARIEEDVASLPYGFGGQVLLYYSGHGFAETIDGRPVQYICPNGSITAGGSLVRTAMMTPEELRAVVEARALPNVLLVLDSCYSGGFADPGVTVDPVPPRYGALEEGGGSVLFSRFEDGASAALLRLFTGTVSPTMTVLAAAGSNESSWEQGGHGIFTAYVLKAGNDLSGGADDGPDGRADADDDGDGYVTTDELYYFAASGIAADWNAEYGTGYSYSTEEYKDFFPHASGGMRAPIVLTAAP